MAVAVFAVPHPGMKTPPPFLSPFGRLRADYPASTARRDQPRGPSVFVSTRLSGNIVSRAWVVIIDCSVITYIGDTDHRREMPFQWRWLLSRPFACLHSACTHTNTLDLVLRASSSRPSTPTSFPLPAAHIECHNDRVLCWPSRKASGKKRSRQTASDYSLSSMLLPHAGDLSCVSSVFL